MKSLAFFFLLAAGVFTAAWMWVSEEPAGEPAYGITFSSRYAAELGLDAQDTFETLLGELGARRVRLPLYWSDIERTSDVFDWAQTDALFGAAEKNGAELTVVVGMKVPRWPECYVPDWAEGLDEDARQQAVLRFIQEAVVRYRDFSSVVRWQVENEPFFPYGECPTISVAQFKERVELVRALDARPILVTVSGEIGPWLDSALAADVLGISMYRQTWNDLYGYFVYPLSPEFYFVRARLVQDAVESVIVTELQAEPWFPEPIASRPLTEWYETFTAEMLVDNVRFAQDAGLPEVYLWGAEWWVALREAGDDRLWNAAWQVFNEAESL
ncbi:endo-1,4-beta-xylanase [Candidatus Uhrbacteria bacterium]|nr:endo-1,4-beta-xylanase [Candidatus Uhrbacteria bacterium]